MLFSSWNFIVYFLPAVLLSFYFIPKDWPVLRKGWLILASLIFYGYWKVEYIPLLLFSILANFGGAELIIRAPSRERAKTFLVGIVILNLLLLGYFKYTNFALRLLGHLVHQPPAHFAIILPLAISFFTFTQISYQVDVYRDRNLHYGFVDYALFVVFFPHLIAGPIVRHWEIIPQFAERTFRINRDNFGVGLTLFLLGLLKKYIANSVALEADAVYDGVALSLPVSTAEAWIGTVAFALQIYFDFSSYSDMAIGIARMFGIKFPGNFDSPYQASSVIVFWERWHQSLTRFLREYVYFSLGGNRRGNFRQVVNIICTMVLSGLWHGAGWTYLIWGAIHGVFLVINHQWRRLVAGMNWKNEGLPARAAGSLLTFGVVCLAWTFFRSPTVEVAQRMLSGLLAIHGVTIPETMVHSGLVRDAILSPLGVQFVSGSLIDFNFHRHAVTKILVLLAGCWLLPNTQQLLEKYSPGLAPISRPPKFHLKLGFSVGLILGFLAYFVVRSCYVRDPSPFIYFNF